MKNKILQMAVLLLIAGTANATVTLDLDHSGLLGDMGTEGTATGEKSITTTIYADEDFTSFNLDSGAISFDLTFDAGWAYVTQVSNKGLGTASGATGAAADVYQPLTISVSNVSGVGGVVITEAMFGGVFNTDSMTANEITVNTDNGSGSVLWDFIDTTSLVLNADDNEVGGMHVLELNFEAIPEPATFSLLGLGTMGLIAVRRKFTC